MASLLEPLEPDLDWGPNMTDAFLSLPFDPRDERVRGINHGKHRSDATEGDLCSSLATLRVAPERPCSPSNLPSLPEPPVPTVNSLFSRRETYERQIQTPNLASPLRISPPLQSSTPIVRSDFLGAGIRVVDYAPQVSTQSHDQYQPQVSTPLPAHRLTRRRPRPHRYRSRVATYRPVDKAESEDLPPPYAEEVEPRFQLPPIPWYDVEIGSYRRFGRHESALTGSGAEAPSAMGSNEGRGDVSSRTHPRIMTDRVVKVKVGVGEAKKRIRDMPKALQRALKRWRITRAKKKLRWLQRNGFLNDQERMLTRELSG